MRTCDTRSIKAGLAVIATIACCSLLSSCAGSPASSTYEYLDDRTGVTITRSASPLLLYRDTPGVAAYARNYVDMGPIMVNRMGYYSYFIWLGIWNTMQPAPSVEDLDGFESITIFADGEPFALDLVGRTPDAIGASRSAYLKPVANGGDAYYSVTIDQIRLIAQSTEIRLLTSGATQREYTLWDGQNAAFRDMQNFHVLAIQ